MWTCGKHYLSASQWSSLVFLGFFLSFLSAPSPAHFASFYKKYSVFFARLDALDSPFSQKDEQRSSEGSGRPRSEGNFGMFPDVKPGKQRIHVSTIIV